MLKKIKGFTLIESVLALSIAGLGAGVLIDQESENRKKTNMNNLAKEMNSVVKGVNHRIFIDGYDPNLWLKKEWTNKSEIVSGLLKELIATGSSCSVGTWNPSVNAENKSKLVKCNLWENKIGVDLGMKAKLNMDSSGFIQSFDLVLNFKDKTDFEDNFIYLKNSLREVYASEKEISGRYSFGYVDLSDTTKELTSVECISNGLNCGMKGSFNRMGGSEYLRADGGNSIIGENLSFVETKNDSSMKCIRWANTKRDGTGVWSKQTAAECGIGVYKDGSAVMLDVVADTGTFTSVLLDKECFNYNWNSTTEQVEKSTFMTACGTLKESGEVYQVVDNTSTSLAVIDDAKIRIATISEIISPLMNVKTLNVLERMNLTKETIFKSGSETKFEKGSELNFEKGSETNFEVGSVVNFNGTSRFNSATTIDNDLNVNDDLNVAGSSTLAELKVLSIVDSDFKVKAPVGDFTNINSSISSINTKIAALNNSVNAVQSGSGAISALSNKVLLNEKKANCSIKEDRLSYSRHRCGKREWATVTTRVHYYFRTSDSRCLSTTTVSGGC